MAVILAICFLVLVLNVVPYDASRVLHARKGQHFQTLIRKDDFFRYESNIKFTVSMDEMPDLPGWLKFEQEDSYSDGILYGTPDDDAVTVGLAVIGWNKETYETFHKVIIVSVSEKAPNNTHPIELRIKNKDALDILMNDGHFFRIISDIWSGAQYITNVDRPPHQSGFHRSGFQLGNHKESVSIGIAGNTQYPKELLSLQSKCAAISSTNKIQKAFMDSGYDIDWCSFRNEDQRKLLDTPKFYFDQNCNYFDAVLNSTKWDIKTSDLTIDIIYVFIAVFVGLLLIVFLTCIMCFNREGLQQRNNLTPREQLLHHKALRRAGAQLRNMSGKDEGNKGFPYGKLDEDSRCGTLSSTKPHSNDLELSPSPPPYRHANERVKRQDSKF